MKHWMRRFHFHLREGARTYRDWEGLPLADASAARAHAAAIAKELTRHAGGPTRHWSLSVEDESGAQQFILLFADLDPLPPPFAPPQDARTVHLRTFFRADVSVRHPENDEETSASLPAWAAAP